MWLYSQLMLCKHSITADRMYGYLRQPVVHIQIHIQQFISYEPLFACVTVILQPYIQNLHFLTQMHNSYLPQNCKARYYCRHIKVVNTYLHYLCTPQVAIMKVILILLPLYSCTVHSQLHGTVIFRDALTYCMYLYIHLLYLLVNSIPVHEQIKGKNRNI